MVFLQQNVHEHKKGRVKRQYLKITQRQKLKTKFTTQNNYQKQPKLFLFIIE